MRGWRDGPVVKNVNCFWRGPEFPAPTHISRLMISCNYSSRVSDPLFWPPLGPAHMWTCGIHTTHANTYIHIYTNDKK